MSEREYIPLWQKCIEEVGGYEEAKRQVEDALQNPPLALFNVGAMRSHLLEYRRHHNIFEVGDRIVSTMVGDDDWKNVVCEILGFHKKMAITTGFSCAIHHYEYRHATDAEITQGHRDE